MWDESKKSASEEAAWNEVLAGDVQATTRSLIADLSDENLPAWARDRIQELEKLIETSIAHARRGFRLTDEDMIRLENLEEQIDRIRRIFSRRKNCSKNCSKVEEPQAGWPATLGEINTRDRARTCDLRFRKPSEGEIANAASDAETQESPGKSDGLVNSCSSIHIDQVSTESDKLLQLEQLKNSTIASAPNVKAAADRFTYSADLGNVVPLRDEQGRRLIHIHSDGHEGLPMSLRLGGVRYEFLRSIVIGPTTTICRYKEVLSPEEESHLPENQVDTGHDGILA